MASIPVGQASPSQPTETLEERFQRLAAIWQKETGHYSSMTKMAAHPAYEEIIAMGSPAVPLLLAELEKRSEHWFLALKAITGACPIDRAGAGRIDKMVEAWLKWGKENGYHW